MSKKLIVIEGFDRCGKDTLMTDFYELTMAQTYFNEGKKDQQVYFDIFFRKNPFDGGYTMSGGLEETIDFIKNFKFGEEEIDYLKSLGVFSTLFNREHTTIKYMDKLKDVEIIHYCLLFNDYDEYLNRLIKIGDSNVQYNKDEFNSINQLYIDILNSLNYKYHINYVYSYNSRRNILENFYKYYDKIK